MRRFDPLTIPLTGQQLIEASAGTGKTYSIALLYLRLVLEKKLEVDKILVVTFTTSATEELRGRIRERIRTALDIVEGRNRCCCELDASLVEHIMTLDDWEEAGILLNDALTRMDESAIFTIHSFCQRILQENAFDSGIPFEVDFLESELNLRHMIIEDFWRRRFYTVSQSEAAWAVSQWSGPGILLDELKGILSKPEAKGVPEVTDDNLREAQQRTRAYLEQVRQQWSKCSREVAEILESDPCLSRDKRKGYGGDRVVKAVYGMEEIASSDETVWQLPECSELLASSVMAGLLKGKKTAPNHSFLDLFDAFYTAHLEFIRLSRIHTLQAACRFLREELDRRKRALGKMYFDDLLTQFDAALSGPNGPRLARVIQSRFNVALVDEFQDTDPVQYRIFHRVFGQNNEQGLFMIGDPKQAIYSFRGADIFTYITAKRQTSASGRFTMANNYRSTAAMVEAVNRLFTRKESFIFEEDIPFEPVEAAGRVDERPLLVNNVSPVPFTAMMMPSDRFASGDRPIAKGNITWPAARWCAAEIGNLIALGTQKKATIGDDSLVAGDIAVLVRTHHEAEVVQQALRERNIASVYYSRDSVFETDEARQVDQLMAALVEPSDEAQVRNALITDFFGLEGNDLDRLARDEMEWAQWLRSMRDYQLAWQLRGFASMFQLLLAERRVVQRVISRPGGERSLTNFLHLAELIQAAAEDVQGLDGMLRWLNSQRENPDKDASTQQLRLESDENLVNIVTVHKAKGLEFPVVFLPFLWSSRTVNQKEIFTFHDRQDFTLLADFGSGEEQYYRQAEEERLAEDLRLLYVAITRACYCCYFCWGRINEMENTALAWLLHRHGDRVPPAGGMDEERIGADIDSLNNASQVVTRIQYPEIFAVMSEHADTDKTRLSVRHFQGHISFGWQITSYSQMVAGHESYPQWADHDRVAVDPLPPDDFLSPFTFPKGAASGNFLHGLLEQIDFPSAGGKKLEELVENHLQRAGISMVWAPVVCQWIKEILDTRMDQETGLTLRKINGQDRLVEMGFYFALNDLNMERLNQVLTSFNIQTVHSQHPVLHGLMKGFVDLIFRFDGRFYIADYKSNYLGSGYDKYCFEQLELAMKEHRYDLQYLIYTVALHRYLGGRVARYDYDRHLGGVYYLFLRGMNPASDAGSGVYSIRPDRALIENLDSCFKGVA